MRDVDPTDELMGEARSQQARQNLPSLTGLRGLAALWVLLFHVFAFQGVPIIEHGYAGVDIFFLLSGFVLSHVYLHDNRLLTARGYVQFLGVRLARIYPLHLFTLFCFLVIVAVLPDFATRYSHAADRFSVGAFIANLFLVQNWGFWLPGNWNGPAWSLSAEWLAYLTFPLLLVLLRRITSGPLLVGFALTVLGGMVCMLFMAGYRSLTGVGLAGMTRMAGEFSSGSFLYAAFATGWRLPSLPGQFLMLSLLGIGIIFPSIGSGLGGDRRGLPFRPAIGGVHSANVIGRHELKAARAQHTVRSMKNGPSPVHAL